tara:strand:+ start:16299 stop:19679 length:3381 start_codon:yes stop_codon:yes gene_type:complete
MRNILLVIFILIPSILNATHLIGGEVTYTCIGDNQYEIKVVIYRDCGPSNSLGTGFDDQGVITIYDMSNNIYEELEHDQALAEFVVDEFTSECMTLPPELCVEKGTYTIVTTLPNNSDGYQIVYQRCCRNQQVINIVNPEVFGSSLVAYIPPSSIVDCNNSPVFNSVPPLALCMGTDVEIDQSASDLDGDNLVYSFTAPFHGANPTPPQNAPFQTYPPPYIQIPWENGYNTAYIMDSDPVINIDSETGLITGMPNQEGYYVIGIKVEEYRNGLYLGEIIRDFRFLVIDCEVATSSVPIADIYCEGLTVDFENESQYASEYYWDFGDDQNPNSASSLEEPTYTYPDSGSYEVTLIANPETFCSDTSVVEFSLYPDLFPFFEAPETICEEDALYDFIGSGIIPPSASYSWDFGENALVQISTELNPDGIMFVNDGSQEITFSVSYLNCDESYTYFLNTSGSDVLSIEASAIEFCEPDLVSFTANTTVPPAELTYDWSLGDGSSSSSENPSIQYEPGLYDVSLTVINNVTGCETLIEELEFVNVFPQPVSLFEASQISGCAPLAVSFDNLSTDADQYTWFVDGNELSTDTDFSYTFNGGNYELSLQAVSDIECTTDDFYSIQIASYDSDILSIETSGNEICEPDVVLFNANTTALSSQLVFDWDLGNGTSSNVQNPTIQYSAGVYDVSLSVYNSVNGCESFIEELEWVSVYSQPEAVFDVSQTSGCAPLSLSFDNLSTNANQYNWFVNSVQISNDNDLSYNFSEGTYNVMLQAVSDVECATDDYESIQIQSLPEVVADFDVNYFCNEDIEVQIQNNSQSVSSLSWSFGDGFISSEDVFSHEYAYAGEYVIELVVENPLSCNLIDIEAFSLAVAPPPGVSFGVLATEDCEEGFVEFENTTILSVYDAASNWEWDFGNGTSNSAFEPSYTYGQEGTYNIELSVETELGCEGSFSDEIVIDFLQIPLSQFSYSIDTCLKNVFFNNESEFADDYNWSFGNMDISDEENPIVELIPGNTLDVTLTVSNDFCYNSVSDLIEFSLEGIYEDIVIPNVFTPNGDYNNDVFSISGIKHCESSVLRIFNRWGEEVFYSIYPDEDLWKGFHRSEEVAEGVYFYVLEMEFDQITGSVTILR